MEENNEKSKYPFIIYFPDNKIQLFDEKKVLEFREKKIREKIKEKSFKKDNLLEFQKRLIVLNEMNTSNSSDNEYEQKEIEHKITEEKIKKDENIKNEYSVAKTSVEAGDNSSSSFCERSTNSSSIINIDEAKEPRTKYYLQYELYDVKVNDQKANNLILHQLENSNKYYYLYENNFITYCYIQNVKFGDNYSIVNTNTDNDYKEEFGLFFCGKNITYNNNNINININCCPNKMICKNCMEKNKKRYKLDKSDDLVLININGRATKKKRNGFHCYGHFSIGKQLEVCAKEFTCQACKLLNKYVNYYICNN